MGEIRDPQIGSDRVEEPRDEEQMQVLHQHHVVVGGGFGNRVGEGRVDRVERVPGLVQ